MLIKKYTGVALSALSVLVLAACGQGEATADSTANERTELKVGVVGDASAEIWDAIAENVAEEGIDLEVVTFSDYVQPNRALVDGDIDINAFQHLAFLAEYVEDSGDDLVPVGYTAMSPTFVFGDDGIDSQEDIPDNAKVAIPNTVTNAERSFLALQDLGLLKLDEDAGNAPTIDDIEELYRGVELVELDPQQVARALGDTDLVIIGSQETVDAGFNPDEAIYNDIEDSDRFDPLKKNAIVAKRDRQDEEAIQKVVAAYQTEEISNLVNEVTASFAIWEEGDTPVEDFDAALEAQRNE